MEDTGSPPASAARRASRPGVIATLVMIAVFAFGVVAGVALDRHLVHERMGGRDRRDGLRFVPGMSMSGGARTSPSGSDAMRRRGNEEFARALGLTPAQAAAVDSVMAQDFRSVDALREGMRPQIEAIIAGSRQRIDSLLTPAQRDKYHALLAEQQRQQQQRLQRRDRGGPGERRAPF